MDYEIIDNALNQEDFNRIKNAMMSNQWPWYYSEDVALPNEKAGYAYFIHHFFYFKSPIPMLPYYQTIVPIINVLEPVALIRAKANLFPKTQEIYEFEMHRDNHFAHKGAILYINTNNGYTKLSDGTKIESVENRLFLFDSSQLHCSSTCSDQLSRVNININYF